MAKSSLATSYPAYAGNYTKGRNTKITQITLHHMAGVLTAKQCGAIFQKVGRNGSSNYGVGSDGSIGCYVDEANTAWADSNWPSNCRTVSIEISNSSTGGQWPVGSKTWNAAVKLVADIAKRNNLGKLKVGTNLRKHSDFAVTTCPGPYMTSKMEQFAKEVNDINYPPAKPATSTTTKPATTTTSGQKFANGTKVTIMSAGNAASDGSGATARGIGYVRYVLSYTKGKKYPYKIGSQSGVVTGYYQESALKKA